MPGGSFSTNVNIEKESREQRHSVVNAKLKFSPRRPILYIYVAPATILYLIIVKLSIIVPATNATKNGASHCFKVLV